LTDEKTDKTILANVGYARVSTLDQDLSLQLDALADAGCGKVFEDRASGIQAGRAGLRAALDYVRDGEVLARIIHRTARNRPRPPNTWARDFIAKNFIKQPIRIVVNDINGLALTAHFS